MQKSFSVLIARRSSFISVFRYLHLIIKSFGAVFRKDFFYLRVHPLNFLDKFPCGHSQNARRADT